MALMTLVNVIKAGVSLLLSILIARLVPPGEYGLVALAVTLLTLLMLLTDLGLASAIVRQPALRQTQAGAALAVLSLAGAVGGCTLLLLSVPLQRQLAMPGLAAVLQGFAAVTLCAIVAVVPRALLERQLRYGRVAAVEAAAVAAGMGGFGAVALAGGGILSLVAFHAALQGVRMLAFLALSRHACRASLDTSGLRELIDVGGAVFVTNLLSFCARNVDRLLIAAVLGSTSLGLYAFAYQFMTLPLVLLTWPASGVLLAALSRLPVDSPDRRTLVLALFTLTAALTFPLMGLMTFALQHPIQAYFGDRWTGASELIAALAPAGALQSLAAYCGAVLVSRRALRLNFMLSLASATLITGCFAFSVWFGIAALTWAYTLTASVVAVGFIYWTCLMSAIGWAQFLPTVVPGAAAALLGLGLVFATQDLAPSTHERWLEAVLLYLVVQVIVLALAGRHLAAAVRSLHAVSGRVARPGSSPQGAPLPGARAGEIGV